MLPVPIPTPTCLVRMSPETFHFEVSNWLLKRIIGYFTGRSISVKEPEIETAAGIMDYYGRSFSESNKQRPCLLPGTDNITSVIYTPNTRHKTRIFFQSLRIT